MSTHGILKTILFTEFCDAVKKDGHPEIKVGENLLSWFNNVADTIAELQTPAVAPTTSTRKRGLVCTYCGAGFGYEGDSPTEEILEAAISHEKKCLNNPYLEKIQSLESLLADSKIVAKAFLALRLGDQSSLDRARKIVNA